MNNYLELMLTQVLLTLTSTWFQLNFQQLDADADVYFAVKPQTYLTYDTSWF